MKHNNAFNKRVDYELPHTFNLCDFDGVIYKRYKVNGVTRTRLIIYEVKYPLEMITESQIQNYLAVAGAIEWCMFDRKSGVYVFRGVDEDFEEIKVSSIYNINNYKIMRFNEFYEWFNADDVTKDVYIA